MPGPYWDRAWNVVEGCTPASEGCERCWAATVASRFRGAYPGLAYAGRWTGEVRCREDRLNDPLHWSKPSRVFVANMGDLFHSEVSDRFIGRVFATMAKATRHTFLVLTKRADRLRSWSHAVAHYPGGDESRRPVFGWPPNVWVGVTVENQQRANERIPHLCETKACHRWVSVEPMVGPVVFDDVPLPLGLAPQFDWVVVGGESGQGARTMQAQWARSVRDQCLATSTPFFFKQWGDAHGRQVVTRTIDGREWRALPALQDDA